MFLHIGNRISVKKKNIIGIFDLDNTTVSKISREFININQKSGRVIYTDTDLPRSFVLLEEGDGFSIRLSRISSVGLKVRAESDYNEDI